VVERHPDHGQHIDIPPMVNKKRETKDSGLFLFDAIGMNPKASGTNGTDPTFLPAL
jgi:hypothetical protein